VEIRKGMDLGARQLPREGKKSLLVPVEARMVKPPFYKTEAVPNGIPMKTGRYFEQPG
jgi:hypothetical protein